ncbi:MAG: T9SS type A sorting domain-containing protein [Paludibacter sp.]
MKTKFFTLLALGIALSVVSVKATLTDPLVLSNFDGVNTVPDAFAGFTYTYIAATGTNSSISTGICLNVAKTVSGANPLVFNGSGTGIFSGAGVSIGASASTQYRYLVIRAKKGNAAYTFNAKFENPVTVTSPVTLPLNIEPSNAYVAGSWVTYVFDLSRANNSYTKLSLFPENNTATSNYNTQIDDIFFTNSVDASTFTNFTPTTPTFSRTSTDAVDILFRPIPNAVKYRVYSGVTLVQDNISATTIPFPLAGFSGSGIVTISSIITSRLGATITGLSTNTSYTYSIVGVDASGNETPKSASVAVSTRRTTAGVNYQLLDDFESGVYASGPWTKSNNGTITIPFTNPLTGGYNSSTNCVKFQHATNSADYAGLNGINEGITTGTGCPYKYLHVKMYRTADALLTLPQQPFVVTLSNCKDHPELATGGLTKSYSSISGGLSAWVDYVYDLSTVSSLSAQTFYSIIVRPNSIAFTTGQGCLSYIDDIYLSNNSTPLTAKFEAVAITATAGIGGTVAGGGSYVKGTNTATITATPSTGYRFVDWTEGTNHISTNATLASFTASADRTLVANFIKTWSISTTATNGSVTGSGTKDDGASVSLVATADAGYRFVDWTEGTSHISTSATLTSFTSTADRTLVANFIKTWSISTTATNGSVTGSGTKDDGASVSLVATANAGYRFVDWTEGTNHISTSATLTSFTATADRTLVANFIKTWSISTTAANGSVTGSGTKDDGASVSLVATADAGYRFVNWTDGGSPISTSATLTSFNASVDRTLVANFTAATTIPVTSNSTAGVITGTTGDVTVTGAGITLTVDAPKTVNSITVGSGSVLALTSTLGVTADLVVSKGAALDLTNTLTVKDLTLKADQTSSFSAKIVNAMTVTGTIKYLKTMDDLKWYFMAFPCDVRISEIRLSDGNPVGVLGTDWFIKYYDGHNRAINGTGTNWVALTSADYTSEPIGFKLNANQGYIFGLKTLISGTYEKELSFPLNPSVVASEADARSIPVTYHTGSLAATNNGWNLVGQPYLSKYNANSGSNVPYMLVSNGTDQYTTYSSTFHNLPISVNPFSAYFVQADAGLQTSGLTFTLAGRQGVRSAVAASLSDLVQLNVTSPSGSDFTGLIMDNDQSTSYQIGQDFVKWSGTGTQLYSILGGVNYAYNGLPLNSVNNLPIGFSTVSGGKSTISIADPSQAPSLSHLWLTDSKTSAVTDLLASSYSFTADAGATTTRFSITAQRVATDNIVGDNNFGEAVFSIVNGKLTITNLTANTSVRVFDAIGRMVANKTANRNTLELKLNASGMYTIQLQNGANSWTKKVIL